MAKSSEFEQKELKCLNITQLVNITSSFENKMEERLRGNDNKY